jgi:hypothetical protein
MIQVLGACFKPGALPWMVEAVIDFARSLEEREGVFYLHPGQI